MPHRLTIYVDARGNVISARATDQSATRHGVYGRTYCGRPVECAGSWFGSQLGYAPCREVIRATREYLVRSLASAACHLSIDAPLAILHDCCIDADRDDVAIIVRSLMLELRIPIKPGYEKLDVL